MKPMSTPSARRQRGGTFLGFVIGVVVGLAAALAVAVYVTKVPVPFVNKMPVRSADQDAAEAQRNKNWDPNAPLYGKPVTRPIAPDPAAAASGPAAAASAAVRPSVPAPGSPSADPLGDLARARAAAAPAVVPGPSAAAAPATTAPGAAPAGATAAVDPFSYFVQAGAFRTVEDANAQRAKIALAGLDAKVSEREQSGRLVFRVRLGPYDRKEDADQAKEKLEVSGFEAAIVRVQR